jgi:hypothetical protein
MTRKPLTKLSAMKSRSDYKRELVWAAELSAAYIIGKGKHMTPQEQVLLARYKEATVRSDDTIIALEKVIVAQREVIDLLHKQIGKMECQMEELRAAL